MEQKITKEIFETIIEELKQKVPFTSVRNEVFELAKLHNITFSMFLSVNQNSCVFMDAVEVPLPIREAMITLVRTRLNQLDDFSFFYCASLKEIISLVFDNGLKVLNEETEPQFEKLLKTLELLEEIEMKTRDNTNVVEQELNKSAISTQVKIIKFITSLVLPKRKD